MKKTLWILGVLIVVILIVVIVVGHKKPAGNMAVEGNTQAAAPAAMQSLRDLAMSGSSLACHYSGTASSSPTGTFEVSGGKMRADLAMISNGKTQNAHVISSNGEFYVWIEGMPMGFKASYNMFATTTTGSGSSYLSSRGVDVDQKVDYGCTPWNADATFFVPPQGVTFRDMTSMMKGQ